MPKRVGVFESFKSLAKRCFCHNVIFPISATTLEFAIKLLFAVAATKLPRIGLHMLDWVAYTILCFAAFKALATNGTLKCLTRLFCCS